jgi:hypothetical protein
VVGIAKPPPEDQRQPHTLAFNLTFEPPFGKCRRRTPDNWDDFRTVDLMLMDGAWTAEETVTGQTPSLTPEGQGWLKDIANVFAILSHGRTPTTAVKACYEDAGTDDYGRRGRRG